MPKGLVEWPKDEAAWEKAKARVREQYPDKDEKDDSFCIYQKMKKSEAVYGDLATTAKPKRFLLLSKALVQGYTRRSAKGNLVRVNPYEVHYVNHPAPVAQVHHEDPEGDCHRALLSHGFTHHGTHPHAMTLESGELYQNNQDKHHFVHVQPGGKWSSFETDGQTHRLRKNGNGALPLHLHLRDGDTGAQEPPKAIWRRMFGKAEGEMEIEKSDYQRRDSRSGKVEQVHDSRQKHEPEHVATEHHANGIFHYGIQREPKGYRIMMRSHHEGRNGEWESALMGVHNSPESAKARLGTALAASSLHGHHIENHDDGVKAKFERMLAYHHENERHQKEAREKEEAAHREEQGRRASIDADFKGAKFNKTKVTIPLKDHDPIEVEGHHIGGLVVHRALGPGGSSPDNAGKIGPHGKGYQITHAASGKGIGLRFDSHASAKLAAHRLSKEGDWTRSEKELNNDKALFEKIRAMRNVGHDESHDPYARFPKGEGKDMGKSEMFEAPRRVFLLSKSEYRRRDPRTGKIEVVHDSRQAHEDYEWADRHKDHKSVIDGKRHVMRLDPQTGGTVLQPLDRDTKSGKRIPHRSDAVYHEHEKYPKYNRTISPLSGIGSDGGKLLRNRLPDYTKQDHLDAAAHHKDMAEFHRQEWAKQQKAAHHEAFGKDPESTDYSIAGIGKDEYSDHHKDRLRHHAHAISTHSSAAYAHEQASHLRNLPKDEDHSGAVPGHKLTPDQRRQVEAAFVHRAPTAKSEEQPMKKSVRWWVPRILGMREEA